jgi:putative selenium metabolism protein SsnA
MGIVLRNALLFDLDPIGVEAEELRIDGGVIVGRGRVEARPGDEVVDCGGAVVMPGLVNGHTHLYSALAVGMPAPPRVPGNFLEVLQLVWWRLDRALDPASNELSAAVGALDAVHCGTTTLIDHHASPNAIDGSLDRIEAGLDRVGVRGVLCYEVTDRNGVAGREAGLEENRRYIVKTRPAARYARAGRFAGLSGAHASFTLDEVSLVGVGQWADEFGVGVHIHVAEDSCDERISRERYGESPLHRLGHNRLLNPDSVLAHCIHLGEEEIEGINEIGLTVAHNPRSNMNNAVGYAPVGKLKCPVMLGTDGIGADMFAEAKVAWLKSNDAGAGIAPGDVVGMLAASARRASRSLGVELGKLTVGAAADVVVTDYVPFTPMDSGNAAGHFIFGMAARDVKDVMVGGEWVMKDRRVMKLEEMQVRAESVEVTRALWKRLERIGV